MTHARFAWLALALAGCFGTETGNPPFAPEVAGEAGAPMGIVPRLSIDRGWVAIDELAFERCDEDAIVVRDAPAALALAGAQSIEADPVLEEGEYCALRFERAPWTEAIPMELEGETLALDASLSDGTPVRIRSARAATIRIAAPAPFEMRADLAGLIVFLDESLLFSGVSFDGAAREDDRSILVSEESNGAILDQIEAQLPGALFLYRDTDGDGVLSTAERDAGPIAP